jgi:hypothetical protein
MNSNFMAGIVVDVVEQVMLSRALGSEEKGRRAL